MRLEVLHRALTRVFPGCGRETDATTDVVVLRRDADYAEIASLGTGGFFSPARAGLLAAPARMVVRIGRAEEPLVTRVFLHELTHRLIAACYPGAPTWLDEGLAGYFETLLLRDRSIVVGTAFYQMVDGGELSAFCDHRGDVVIGVPRSRVPYPSEVVAMTPQHFRHDDGGLALSSEERTLAYVGAWATVHALMLGRDRRLRAQLPAFLARLARGGEDVDFATATSIDVAALDAAVDAHVGGARLLVRRVPYEWPPVAEPRLRAMPAEEAHVLWAELYAAVASRAALARAEEHLALAVLSPAQRARALLVRASIAPPAEVALWVRQAHEIAPDDLDVVRAWAMVALHRGDRAERVRAVTALAQRSDLRPIDGMVIAELALALGDVDPALAHGRAVVAASPELAESHLVLGRVLSRAGLREEARRELEIALHRAWRRPALASEARRLLDALAGDGG